MTELARGLGWFGIGVSALIVCHACVGVARALVAARRWRKKR